MLAFLLTLLVAASDTTVTLDRLDVTATRTTETAASAPASVAVLLRDPVERATDAGTSLDAALRGLPGLWIADRENVALGERLAVRGMGARAGFGVRGVGVVLDGVPLTLPDGQAGLLIVDPSLVRRAELLRGPASTYWGNGSGGVLLLETIPDSPTASVRTLGGSFGLVRVDGEAAATVNGQPIGFAASHIRRDGFRDHSAFAVTRARGYGRFALGSATLTTTAAVEWAPDQEHPGALTLDEFRTNPRGSQANFVAQRAGKDSRQGQLGLTLTAPTEIGTVRATGYGVARRLENPLPFAWIEVDRLAGGLRLALERTDGPVTWSVGSELGHQADDRLNFANEGGARGARRLDQFETVTAGAAFAQGAWRAGPWTVSAGLRHDQTRFAATDRLGDGSGSRVLSAWSPALGVSRRVGPALVYTSLSTAFETPTTTELANRPDGETGFNAEVGPQRTRGLDVGVRGTDAGGRVFYDLALYALAIDDQLVPFEGPDGRSFFRNAGQAQHLGAELLIEAPISEHVTLGGTATVGRFRFVSGPLDGSEVPGIAPRRLSVYAQGAAGPVTGRVSVRAVSEVFANDANTERADGYAVTDFRLGTRVPLPHHADGLFVFSELRNAFDARYVSSVALNAAGGRFIEPGAGRSLVVGLAISL